jgi:hypothetical protein
MHVMNAGTEAVAAEIIPHVITARISMISPI